MPKGHRVSPAQPDLRVRKDLKATREYRDQRVRKGQVAPKVHWVLPGQPELAVRKDSRATQEHRGQPALKAPRATQGPQARREFRASAAQMASTVCPG